MKSQSLNSSHKAGKPYKQEIPIVSSRGFPIGGSGVGVTPTVADKLLLFMWKQMGISIQCCGYLFVPKSVSEDKCIASLIDK